MRPKETIFWNKKRLIGDLSERKRRLLAFLCALLIKWNKNAKNMYTADIYINCSSAISTGVQNFINMFYFIFLHNFVIQIIENHKILILT